MAAAARPGCWRRCSVPRRSDIDADLEELYAQIPDIPDCDGRCWRSCGVIDASWRELQRLRAAGIRLPEFSKWQADALGSADGEHMCPALTADHRCAVYALRPLICRLWGTVESLRCPYGCVPEGGFLPAQEGMELMLESLAIGGHERNLEAGDAAYRQRMAKFMAMVSSARLQGHAEPSALPAGFRRLSKGGRSA